MIDQDRADSWADVSPFFQLGAFEAPFACLAAALVQELADVRGSVADLAGLQERWIERWPAMAHGVGDNSVAGRVGRGLRMLHAAGAVHLDQDTGTVTIADPTLLAMSVANQLIVTRPDGCRIRPRNWARIPEVPEHLAPYQHHVRQRRQLDDSVREPGPLGAEAEPGYSLALRSRGEFTGTIAACDASLRHARLREPPCLSGGFHLGMAFIDNGGGWWVASEFLNRSWRPQTSFAELVAAAAAIVHHPRAVHIETDCVHVRHMINQWRNGERLPGPDQPRILALAAQHCVQHPNRFTVEWIRRNTTAPHKVVHELSRLLSANHNDETTTIADIKARAIELMQNLGSTASDARNSPRPYQGSEQP